MNTISQLTKKKVQTKIVVLFKLNCAPQIKFWLCKTKKKLTIEFTFINVNLSPSTYNIVRNNKLEGGQNPKARQIKSCGWFLLARLDEK